MLQAPCGSAGLYAAPASARRCTANSDFKAQQHGARGEKRPSSRLGRRLETQSTGLGGLRVLRRRSGLRIVRAAHEGNGNGNGNGNGSKTRQNVGSGGNFFDGEKEKKKEALLLRLFENMFGFVFSEHDHKELEGGNREAAGDVSVEEVRRMVEETTPASEKPAPAAKDNVDAEEAAGQEDSAAEGGGVTQWAASVVSRILATLTPRVFIGGNGSSDSADGLAHPDRPTSSSEAPEPPLPAPRTPEGAAAAQKVDEQRREERGESPEESRARVSAAASAAAAAAASKAGSAAVIETAPFCDLPPPPPSARRGLRLLSLEGGGIRGLTLVWQLMEVERLSGKPIHEMFDLIGGTSTGGIIGLAVANRVSLADVEKLYFEVAKKVFAAKQNGFIRQILTGAQQDAAPLIEILKASLGQETPMRAPADHPGPHAFVVATRVVPIEGGKGGNRLEPHILRTYESKAPGEARNDASAHWPQWEAAAATSAAPTIFPPVTREPRAAGGGDGGTFVDGALSGYNNPSLLVLTEGLDYAAGRPIDLMVSLGCGDPEGVSEGTVPTSMAYWFGQIYNLAFDVTLQEERTLRILRQTSPGTRYVRLAPPTGYIALTEHRDKALAEMKADLLAFISARQSELQTLVSWLRAADEDTAGAAGAAGGSAAAAGNSSGNSSYSGGTWRGGQRQAGPSLAGVSADLPTEALVDERTYAELWRAAAEAASHAGHAHSGVGAADGGAAVSPAGAEAHEEAQGQSPWSRAEEESEEGESAPSASSGGAAALAAAGAGPGGGDGDGGAGGREAACRDSLGGAGSVGAPPPGEEEEETLRRDLLHDDAEGGDASASGGTGSSSSGDAAAAGPATVRPAVVGYESVPPMARGRVLSPEEAETARIVAAAYATPRKPQQPPPQPQKQGRRGSKGGGQGRKGGKEKGGRDGGRKGGAHEVNAGLGRGSGVVVEESSSDDNDDVGAGEERPSAAARTSGGGKKEEGQEQQGPPHVHHAHHVVVKQVLPPGPT